MKSRKIIGMTYIKPTIALEEKITKKAFKYQITSCTNPSFKGRILELSETVNSNLLEEALKLKNLSLKRKNENSVIFQNESLIIILKEIE